MPCFGECVCLPQDYSYYVYLVGARVKAKPGSHNLKWVSGVSFSTVLNQAITNTPRGNILLAPESFNWDGTILGKSAVRIFGSGKGVPFSAPAGVYGTRLLWTGAAGLDGILFADVSEAGLFDMLLEGNWAGLRGLRLHSAQHCEFGNLGIMQFPTALQLDADGGVNTNWCTFKNVYLFGTNALVLNGVDGAYITQNEFIFGDWRASSGHVVKFVKWADTNRFYNLHLDIDTGVCIEYNTDSPVNPRGVSLNNFYDCDLVQLGVGSNSIIVNRTEEMSYFDYGYIGGVNASNPVINAGGLLRIRNAKSIRGLLSDNSGIGTGTGLQQTIAHGLYAIPTRIQLTDLEVGAAPYVSAPADANNIYVTAVLNQDYLWKVWVE